MDSTFDAFFSGLIPGLSKTHIAAIRFLTNQNIYQNMFSL